MCECVCVWVRDRFWVEGWQRHNPDLLFTETLSNEELLDQWSYGGVAMGQKSSLVIPNMETFRHVFSKRRKEWKLNERVLPGKGGTSFHPES